MWVCCCPPVADPAKLSRYSWLGCTAACLLCRPLRPGQELSAWGYCLPCSCHPQLPGWELPLYLNRPAATGRPPTWRMLSSPYARLKTHLSHGCPVLSRKRSCTCRWLQDIDTATWDVVLYVNSSLVVDCPQCLFMETFDPEQPGSRFTRMWQLTQVR